MYRKSVHLRESKEGKTNKRLSQQVIHHWPRAENRSLTLNRIGSNCSQAQSTTVGLLEGSSKRIAGVTPPAPVHRGRDPVTPEKQNQSELWRKVPNFV